MSPAKEWGMFPGAALAKMGALYVIERLCLGSWHGSSTRTASPFLRKSKMMGLYGNLNLPFYEPLQFGWL